jgi:regulator of sigma E protease
MFEFLINYILLPVFILAVVIFVHELGHFLIARYYKIPTPVFSVGFGREIIGFTDKSGTRWKLSIFPLGGYVSVNSTDKDPLYQRTLIAIGGPLANFVFAIIAMILVSMTYGSPKTPPYVAALSLKGGAYEAGMLPMDKILKLDDRDIPYYMEDIKDIIKNAKGDFVSADILRNGQKMTLSIPVKDMSKTGDFGEDYQQRMMGVTFVGQNLKLNAVNSVAGVDTLGNVSLARSEIIKNFGKNIVINFGKGKDLENFFIHIDPTLNKGLLDEHDTKYSALILWDNSKVDFIPIPLTEATKDSLDLAYQASKKTLGVLYQIIVGKKDTGDLGGVVAISSMTGEVAEQSKLIGFYYMFKFIAVLSVNIGFINLLPLPMFDGGHLMFYAIEAMRGRPPSLKVKGYVYGVSIMFILILSLMVGYRDIMDRISP